MKIIVDAFGGDHAPEAVVRGAVKAIDQDKGFDIVLAGKLDVIEHILQSERCDRSRIELLKADDVVTNEDVPTFAIKNKPDSSLVVALSALKEREDIVGMVSAGSTGAVLAGSLLRVGRIKGIQRPALAPILPTVTGGHVLLIDCGANVDCKPQYLCQFAIMGSAYMSAVYGIDKPRVGLLSNGTEDKKGNELNHQAFAMLKEMKNVNFVGNMEARDNLSGNYDVIVTDGFAGNVALKASEGVSETIFTCLKQEIERSGRAKIGYLFMKKALKSLKKRMDYNQTGGAPFLGVEKIIVKSHGSSKETAICNSILQVKKMHEAGMLDTIRQAAAHMETEKEPQ